MYITKIDDLLDKIVDDFYNTVILKDNRLKKIWGETNFVKFQRDLNDIMITYANKIDLNSLRQIVTNEDNVNIIVKIIKRYIAYYLFLTIGFFYTQKNDAFINNIIEFSKNQGGYNYKVENFFNSENNSNIIKFYEIIKKVLIILTTEQNKLSSLTTKPEFKSSIEFLNELGQEYVESVFVLENINGNVHEQAHNIIKTLIIKLIYQKVEKKEVYRLLELVEQEQGEYMFIDIVLPKHQYIDFSSIEEVLTQKEIKNGLAHELWNYLIQQEEQIGQTFESIDDKISKLINSRIIVPITEDFLLYHKDTEKYDKSTKEFAKKKKEDTKIRYIITKIDTFADLYSDSVKKDQKTRQLIKKSLYMPLVDRKAILINNNEEMKIINKLLNQGRRSIENNEYYNDLIQYRLYPYINFKEFQKYGFSFVLNETIDAIRSVSLEKTGEFKQHERSDLQLRIGGKDQTLNIVGFVVPSNIVPINCMKVRDILDIRQLDKNNKNGYDLLLSYLKQTELQQKKHNSSIFWLFDLEHDSVKLNTYEQLNKLTNQEQIRHIIGKLYDDVVRIAFNLINEKIDEHDNLSIDDLYKILNKLENKYLSLSDNENLFDEIEKKIYLEKSIKIIPSYDKNEDIFHGLSGKIIKLPIYEKPKPPKMPTIRVTINKQKKTKAQEILETIDAVCQHNITWEDIVILRKNEPNKYSQLLYNFIQQYVTENTDQEYVCKSCGFQLNIKKYIIDGKFDNDSQKFVPYSIPMDIAIEDILEYEKYKIAIRNIEKLIEKIATIVNMPYFLGTSTSVKWKKNTATKNIIDMIIANNKFLKPIFKDRNELLPKMYGISRDLTDLFVFDLDNSIFIYSSKEKDYYKHIKHNNVIVYIIITMILELNESHIGFLYGDKKGICNYTIYEKYGQVLFEGLKIRTNKGGDLIPIKNYKILCYVLYLISCISIKYGLWFYENKNETHKKKFNPVVQKIMIHTFVDLINSILENTSGTDHIYEITSTKFYDKLSKLFNNDALLEKMLANLNETSSVAVNKKSFIITKFKPVELQGSFQKMKFDNAIYNNCRLPKFYSKTLANDKILKNSGVISNITNCSDGQFHKWAIKGNTYVCKLCNVSTDQLKLDEKETDKIANRFKYAELQKLATKMCKDGKLHKYLSDIKGTNCDPDKTYIFSDEQLDKFEKTIVTNIKTINSQEKITAQHEQNIEIKTEGYMKTVSERTQEKYEKYNSQNKFQFIEDFIKNIQTVIGTKITMNNEIVYLKDNAYIIDHDHMGYPLENKIILTDSGNKISFKQNHPFFKTDVIYYTNTKIGKIDVFYDATTNILLGYKDSSKDFVLTKKTDNKITIIYSIFNRLKYMGFESQFINIKNKIKNKCFSDEEKSIVIVDIIKDSIRDRIQNLKKIIYEFQRFAYRIKFGYIDKKESSDNNKSQYASDDEVNIVLSTIEDYQKKIMNISLSDANNEHCAFKHWKAIANQTFINITDDAIININKDANLIHVDDISKYDNSGNLLLFYIVSEMNKIIAYNMNKPIKSNVVYFLLDFINILFNMFNKEYIVNTYDIKRFEYILQSSSYIHDVEQKGHGLDDFTTGIYSEIKDTDDDIKNNQENDEQREIDEDNKEEADALDIDPESLEEDYGNSYRRTYTEYDDVVESSLETPEQEIFA
jgi:hypothetical protein